MDLSRYASLLQTAKAEHDAGDLKNAYGSYLKAHSVIMRTLGTQIVFRDRDSIDVMPANYTQLNLHAQEILRRLNDIVETAKNGDTRVTRASTSSSPITGATTPIKPSSSATPSSTALAATAVSRPGLPPSAPSQRSTAMSTTATINKRTKKNIPMIPFSPLTKQALLHSYSLSQVTARFEQAKQGSNPDGSPSPSSGSRDLAHLRRLIEDVRIQRAKLDAVNIQIQSVASSTITSWDSEMVARQLTIIDTSLFKDVAIPRDLVRSDRSLSAARRCIDFENYVAHSLAHQLLQEWDSGRQQHLSSHSPTTMATNSSSKSAAHMPAPNAVAHLIRVAQILLHVYRNFNSFMAVMRALTSPEIKRMHRVWSGVPSKTKDAFKKLSAIYHDDGDLRGYRGTLLQKLSAFQDVGKDAVVAIPWMRYHQDEVKSIINSYLTGHETSGGSNEIVLSAPGARKLSSVAALLLHCRTNESNLFDKPEQDSKASQLAHTKNREPMLVEGIKTPLTPTWDLTSLGHGDIALHHWLLSRPFLNKQQLIDESLEIEPLFHGEELACYSRTLDSDGEDSVLSAEDETGTADSETFEHVIAPEQDLEPFPEAPTAAQKDRPMLSRSPVSETELNDIMDELLNDDDATDGNGLFGDIGDDDSGSDSGIASGQRFGSRPRLSTCNQDVLQFLGIDADEASDDNNDDGDENQGIHSGRALDKGKGRAAEGLNDDEIAALLAQVKGLVRESSDHAGAVEASLTKTDFEENEAQEFKSKEEAIVSPGFHASEGRTFEPFEKELETDVSLDTQVQNDMPASDPLGLGIKRDIPPAISTPPPQFMFSLEAMRMQLQSLDNGLEAISVVEETDLKKAEEEAFPQSADSESTGTEQTGDMSPDQKIELPSSPPTAVSTGNPFAHFMNTKSPASSPETSISPLAKGRRRKIQVDRSKTTSIDTIPHILSPPRPTVSFGFDSTVSNMAEIEAKAKESLASHAALSEAIHGDSKADHAEVSGHASEPAAEQESISIAEEMEAMEAVVTLEELDKNFLNSSLPSSNPLGEDSASTLTTLAASATKETAATCTPTLKTPSDARTASHTDTSDPFRLGDNLFNNTIERVDAAGSSLDSTSHALEGFVPVEENSAQKERDPKTLSKDVHNSTSPLDKDDEQVHLEDHNSNKGLEDQHMAGEMSPPSDDGRTRANRHRRRIVAEGMISLPVPSKALLSKSSTGSLSNAFQASASSSTSETADARMMISGQFKENGALGQKIHSFEQHESSTHQAKKTMMTTTTRAEGEARGHPVESKGIEKVEGDTVARTGKNDDIVAKTIIADVDVDVTASEVSSFLTKSPLEEDHGATMREDEQKRGGGEQRESADQD